MHSQGAHILPSSSFDSAVGIADGVLLESFFITFTVGGLINCLVGWLVGWASRKRVTGWGDIYFTSLPRTGC